MCLVPTAQSEDRDSLTIDSTSDIAVPPCLAKKRGQSRASCARRLHFLRRVQVGRDFPIANGLGCCFSRLRCLLEFDVLRTESWRCGASCAQPACLIRRGVHIGSNTVFPNVLSYSFLLQPICAWELNPQANEKSRDNPDFLHFFANGNPVLLLQPSLRSHGIENVTVRTIGVGIV
jgi:hypothetical protein